MRKQSQSYVIERGGMRCACRLTQVEILQICQDCLSRSPPPPLLSRCPYIIYCSGILTHISWSATGCRHNAIVDHLREAKVADHDLGVFVLAVVQDVLGLDTGTNRQRSCSEAQSITSSRMEQSIKHL